MKNKVGKYFFSSKHSNQKKLYNIQRSVFLYWVFDTCNSHAPLVREPISQYGQNAAQPIR